MKVYSDKDQVVRNFLPKIKVIALNLLSTLPKSVELDDLIQEGVIGLLQAYDRYDPNSGATFYTFALNRIKGAMIDYLRRIDWLPKELRHLLKEYEELISKNPSESFTDEEIMQKMNIGQNELERIKLSLRKSQILELDSYFFEKSIDEGSIGSDDEMSDPELIAYKEILHEKLRLSINLLPEKEKLVLSLYYEKGLTFKEIGHVLELSESRISQMHSSILAKLKISLKGDDEYGRNA